MIFPGIESTSYSRKWASTTRCCITPYYFAWNRDGRGRGNKKIL